MPRRRVAIKRKTLPDPRFKNETVARLISLLMRDGKKSIAEKILYGALENIKQKGSRDPLATLMRALDNVMPAVEVKSRRVGGATYQIPVEVRPVRARALAMRWLIKYARDRGEKGMTLRLAGELMDAADEESGGRGKGGAVKKREDTHRMAEANRAFSHFRW